MKKKKKKGLYSVCLTVYVGFQQFNYKFTIGYRKYKNKKKDDNNN